MQRDFKSFSEEKKFNEKNLNQNENILNQNQDKVNEYKNIYDKYKDMNSTDLMSNLMSEASKLKKQGKLDDNTLNSLSNTLSPFLNQEQQQVLANLINAIKEQK